MRSLKQTAVRLLKQTELFRQRPYIQTDFNFETMRTAKRKQRAAKFARFGAVGILAYSVAERLANRRR